MKPRAKAASPKKRKRPDRTTHRTSEMYNAEQLIRLHGANLRFVAKWEKWLVWDGKRWAPDEDGAAVRCAMDSARAMAAAALEEVEGAEAAIKRAAQRGDAPTPKEEAAFAAAKRFHTWCITSQSERVLKATLALAARSEGISITHHKLDTHHMLLNCENGTLDLKTGKLRSHLRSDLITKLVPVEYKPGAASALWTGFIDRVMGGDKTLVSYLQRIAGYCLTGEIRENALFFFYGEGNNGKSTYINTLLAMFGDYGGRAARGILMKSRFDRHPTSLATLHGKRFISVPETGENDELDEPLIKDLTGNDIINARRMREDEWWWLPTHKLVMAGNHKPRVIGTDLGIWRRIRLAPWTVQIPANEVDTSLGRKLRDPKVLAAVLAWCVKGCLEWQKKGLGEPPAVTEATEEYRREQDTLGQFHDERVVFDPALRCRRDRLRAEYIKWCEETGFMPVGHKRFAQALAKHHVTSANIREAGGTYNGWAGVALKRDVEAARAKQIAGPSAKERAAERWQRPR